MWQVLNQEVALKDGWMIVWIRMAGGLHKYRREKGLPGISHQVASCCLSSLIRILILPFLILCTLSVHGNASGYFSSSLIYVAVAVTEMLKKKT